MAGGFALESLLLARKMPISRTGDRGNNRHFDVCVVGLRSLTSPGQFTRCFAFDSLKYLYPKIKY